MRVAVAALLAAVVTAGAAGYVATNVDTAAAEYRARAARTLIEAQSGIDGCGCTADVRAKDRLASRATADDGSSE